VKPIGGDIFDWEQHRGVAVVEVLVDD